MAKRVVISLWRGTALVAAPLGILLLGASACSSFDPVKETRFTLLHEGTYDALDISGAHWLAYDDQHSSSSTCTNGAAGNHEPEECTLLELPSFTWAGSKCPPSETQLAEGHLPDPGPNGSICIQGVIRPSRPCGTEEHQCIDPDGIDYSNMWGAGVGLAFSDTGKRPWDGQTHEVKGVAFDFTGSEYARLNLRVQIPIVLDPSRRVSPNRPLMRSDGSVLGTDNKIYACDSDRVEPSGMNRSQTTLGDALVGNQKGGVVTSERHPYGSPFWQVPTTIPTWGSSPVKVGHNEFGWQDVKHPPETPPDPPQPDPNNYTFSETQILGIHFQVGPPVQGNKTDMPFAFCISKLALLFKD